MLKSILFVCTGNTCRSPLAEGLFRLMAESEGLRIDIKSAGTTASDGCSVSTHSKRILDEKGARSFGRSRSINAELVREADLILTMTTGHKRQILSRFPEAGGKVFTLKEFAQADTPEEEALQDKDRERAEFYLKQALEGRVPPEDRVRAMMFELGDADYDISDPFGGSLQEYRACAVEIEENLRRIMAKLRNWGPGDSNRP